jgi:hypothetical protein
MFRRFLFVGVAVLALVCVMETPGRARAQHGRGGSHSGSRSSFRPGVRPGFGEFDHRGFGRRDFDRDFNGRRFDRFEDRLERRIPFGVLPHFTGGFLPGFPGGFMLGF